MKSLSFTIVTVSFLGLLAYTNPTLESYESFFRQEIRKSADESGLLAGVLGRLLGGIASESIISLTIRKDYVFLSTYETKIGNEQLRVLGVLRNFIILETPQSLKARN